MGLSSLYSLTTSLYYLSWGHHPPPSTALVSTNGGCFWLPILVRCLWYIVRGRYMGMLMVSAILRGSLVSDFRWSSGIFVHCFTFAFCFVLIAWARERSFCELMYYCGGSVASMDKLLLLTFVGEGFGEFLTLLLLPRGSFFACSHSYSHMFLLSFSIPTSVRRPRLVARERGGI